jgi:chemotaxis protein CheZ
MIVNNTKTAIASLDLIQTVNSDTNILIRVGHIARALHDTMAGLGLSKILEQVARDIPDTRDRLKYISTMTEQAAERVLNATDKAIPIQDDLTDRTALLVKQWQTVLSNPSLKSEYNAVAEQTVKHLQHLDQGANDTKAILLEIMMAQDFQDITGQVIKKITQLINEMERQLLQVLVDFSTVNIENYPNLNHQQTPTAQDVSETNINQSEVDGLLESLGF